MKFDAKDFINIVLFIFLMILIISIWVKLSTPTVDAVGEKSELVAPQPVSYPSLLTTPTFISNEREVIYIQAPLQKSELIFVDTQDKTELKVLINDCISRKELAHSMANNARGLGYDESHPVIILAKEEWATADTMQVRYEEIYTMLDYAFWDRCFEEYPEATYVWLYMRELGYNEYVCAGIMGNMMAECGGQTLNLDYDIYNRTGEYYGICQWSNKYYPQVHGTELSVQCDFLRDTIQIEIDMFGYLYKNNFTYADFLEIDSVREAAFCFALTYEKCGSVTHSIRQDNAEIAYNYFVIQRDK